MEDSGKKSLLAQSTKTAGDAILNRIQLQASHFKVNSDHLKKPVEEKYNEIADMVETDELQPEQGYDIYQEFEHNMLMRHTKEIEEASPVKFDDTSMVEKKKKDVDDPPGDGPILRWQTRVVFVPGGDSWHPKNRKGKIGCNFERTWPFQTPVLPITGIGWEKIQSGKS